MNKGFAKISLIILIITGIFSSSKANTKLINQAHQQQNVVVGYLTFSQFSPYSIKDIHFKNLTHIVQSFMSPVSATDPTLRYIGDESVFDKYAGLAEKNFTGYGKQLVKEAHGNNVQVLLGLSGGQKMHAKDLKAIFADAGLRKQFIDNILAICENTGYDGVDLDYEYAESAVEKEGINNFISELRGAFQKSKLFSKKAALITLACPKFDNYGQWYDFTYLSKYCDWFNVMTYAYEASFTKFAGHNCPLFPEKAAKEVKRGNSVSSTMIDYFMKDRGIAPQKLVMGLAFYGWLHQDFKSLYAVKTKSIGLTYTEIEKKYLHHPDWVKKWSDEAQVPYLINAKTNEMITYDDERSIQVKTAFARKNGFKGVMIWELSRGFLKDKKITEPLLTGINEMPVR